MWGFCKQWAWDQLQGFLTEEGYVPCTSSVGSVQSTLLTKIQKHNWDVNPKGPAREPLLAG